MGITIGMVGAGVFAQSFIPLFQAHPLVDDFVLCDLDAVKLQAVAAKFGISRTYPSLDAVCESDVNAVAIMTQNWLHGPQSVQALQAGKHVYSAVPTGITVEEIATLVRTVESTGRVYMLGETSYYYPAVIHCRQRHAAGDFGAIVYSEAEYYHDWDHGLYDVMKWRGGERWRAVAGHPPMHYPTHSTSQIISVTGAHMTHVSCQGFVDQADDGIYGHDINRWGNSFSNETALFTMSDGSCCRINEFRRIGHPGAVRMSLFGTAASFEANRAGSMWLTKHAGDALRLDDELAATGVDTAHGVYHKMSRVHPVSRLPREFAGLPNGHHGSHQFLVDDFVTACVGGTTPANNVWMAARYALPGIVAHESAVRGGERLAVPDLGAPPAA
ncbi:MAG: Gfo/Idh/MocA family protein [Thermomicrobiales bacterium]